MSKDNIKRRYSFSETIFLAWYLFRSKLICKDIRLIRFPIVIRGGVFVAFGKNLTTGHWCRFEALQTDDSNRKRIIFGNNIQINDFVHISAIDKVEIGDGCLFASHVYISDNSHGRYDGSVFDSNPDIAPDHREYITAPVRIGKNVWLGEGVIVLPGVTIGDGAIIGAHSVVNRDIPSRTIAVGSPAKVVKRWNDNKKRWEKV